MTSQLAVKSFIGAENYWEEHISLRCDARILREDSLWLEMTL